MQMRMTTKTKTDCKSGFTLLETTALLVIICLLAVVAIPNFVKAREQGQLKSIVNNLRVTKDSKELVGVGATATTPVKLGTYNATSVVSIP
jgi:type II secretory pathway pseudopilin PulG